LISIIIIKLIINLISLSIKLIIILISWYHSVYYSAHNCVSRSKNSARSLMNLKMYIKSHKKL